MFWNSRENKLTVPRWDTCSIGITAFDVFKFRKYKLTVPRWDTCSIRITAFDVLK